MTENKKVTNRQILDVLGELRMNDAELNALAIKIVSKVHNLFKETLDTTEEDNHKPVE